MRLKKSVGDYNTQLRLLNLRDHQVEYARFSILKVVTTLTYRLGKLALLAVGTLPGLVLFAPVFVASKLISRKKSKEALAASTVKLQGRDVMATWKLLVALAFAPLLYTFYGICFTVAAYRNRIWGTVPEWLPFWALIVAEIILFPSVTVAALRFGEVGMDIFKSLRPLVLSLNPSSANTLVKLRRKRETLSADVTDLINTLGPDMFPDFDAVRIIANPLPDDLPHTSRLSRPDRTETEADADITDPSRLSPSPRSLTHAGEPGAGIGGGSSVQGHLPRNESFGNLGNIGLFATRPPSRNRSRSNSQPGGGGSSFPLHALSTLDSKEGLDEVSQKIRLAMKERGHERVSRRQSQMTMDGECQ